jgi:hypothetical protein
MTIGFVVSPTDFGRLRIRFLDQLKPGPIVCQSQTDIHTVSQADEIYFVASRLSMCSTEYQQLVSTNDTGWCDISIDSERTVGAALRGRPFVECNGFK